MNIFCLSENPIISAQMMADSHVVKMILESAQMLSTAHRLLDGTEYRDEKNRKQWKLPTQDFESKLYKATHINHPCAIWARSASDNYIWLWAHMKGLIDEYEYRYGEKKIHKCKSMLWILSNLPKNIPIQRLSPHPMAMPDKYKIDRRPVDSYRLYYKKDKVHLLRYTKRKPPAWLTKDFVPVTLLKPK